MNETYTPCMAKGCEAPATVISVLSFGTYFWCELHNVDTNNIGKDMATAAREAHLRKLIETQRGIVTHNQGTRTSDI